MHKSIAVNIFMKVYNEIRDSDVKGTLKNGSQKRRVVTLDSSSRRRFR